MNRCMLGACLVAFAIFLPANFAGEKFELEKGYVSLFNGTDFTGWTYKPTPKEDLKGKSLTGDKRIEVKDGLIVVNPGGGIKDLYTLQEFNSDFHLKLQFRAAPRADSGVYIRGKQLQVRDYPAVGPYKKLEKFRDGDWNDLEIEVKGTMAVCKCNGEVLDAKFAVPAKGAIGLQAESGKFEFRRVRIKTFEAQ